MTDLERRLKKAKDATADAGASSEHSETDLERRLRIAHEEKKQYTRSGEYRRNALQNRTESFMDIVTQGETEARAGIDRYKANRDADYYQQMNKAGVTFRDQDMINRSVTGYKGAYDLWKTTFDRETDAAAARTRREREMTENPAKAPTVSDIVSRYSGKTKTRADLGNNVRGAIDAYKRQSDAAKAAPTPEEARQQAEESVQYWQNVAREAARYGDVYRQATAKKHLADSVENYSRATKGYFDNLKNTDPGTYYALTMTPEEIDRELELLNNGAYLDSKITNSLTNDERIMGEYWHRTPQEQRQYEHNLERARFAGETDDERNAYISSEKEAYRDARNRMLNDASVEGSVGSNQEPYNRREEITQANEARKSVLENARMTQKVIQAEREGITNDPQIIASGKQKFEKDQQEIWNNSTVQPGWTPGSSAQTSLDLYQHNYSSAYENGYVLDSMTRLTDEQRNKVYALYDRDPETALKLAQTYAKALDDKVYQEIFDWVAKDSGWQFGRRAVGNLAGAVANLASGLDPFGYGGQSAGKIGDALIGGAAQSATRNGWFGIEELGGDQSWIDPSVPFVGRGRAGEASQLVSSMEQSALTTLPAMIAGRYDAAAASWLETAGLLLQSSSAARSDYRESIEAGLDDTTAKIHAVAAGIAEYTFEKVSFDKLLAQNTSRMTFKKVMKDVLVQAGIEGSEELHTTLANTIMDEIISGDGKSKIDRRIAELVQGGMSMKEAKGVAEKEWLTGIVNDFIGGAASGGFMTGAHYAVGATVNTAENKIANNAVNQLVGQYAGAQTENFTDADTIEAAKAFADDRGIDASGLTEAAAKARDASVDEAMSALRGSTQSESETEKLSKRDSRKAGKAWTEIRTQISQDFDGKIGAQAAQLYDQMAEQYGAGIKTIVDEVVTTQARQSYLEQSQTAQELQQKVKPQVEALPEGGYKQASMRAYDQAEYQLRQQEAAKTADRLAKAGNIDTEVTYTNKDGSETTAQIADLSDDLASVVLDNGETVPIKDVQMSADTASAIRIFSRIAGKKAASLAFREYRAYLNNGGTEGYRFAEAVATAYGQGLNGVLTPEQALKMAPDFAQGAAQRAFNAGRQKHQANIENEQARRKAAEEKAKAEGAQTVKGELRGEGSIKWEKMNATRRTRAQNQIKYLDSIAQGIGVDIELFQSEATRRGKRMAYRGEQGAWYVDKATGKPVIRIDVNAGANFISDLNAALIATTGHELAHHFQHISPAVYDEYRQAVVQAILSTENGYEKLQRLIEHEKRINRKADGTTISTDEAIDEVVADASRDRVGDRNLWKNVADSMSDEARGKVAQWLHDRFSKILKLTKRYAGFEAADLVLQSAQEYQDLIGELWQKLATQAANAVDVRSSDYPTDPDAASNNPSSTAFAMRFNTENQDIRYSEREDQGLRDRVSDLEEQLEFAEINGLSQTEIRRLNNELIKARGRLDAYTANQRRQVKRTSFNEILRNLENYERIDLDSLAEQISDNAWDDYDELSDEELIDALRDTINERLEDFAPGEADDPKYGLFVKKPKTSENISVVRYSDRDAEYLELAKDPEKNATRLQEMVDEAAKAWGAKTENGKPKAFYHSTNADFTVFHKGHGMLGEGIYFSTFGQNFYGKNRIKAYLKYDNAIDFRDVPLEGREKTSSGIPMGIIDDFYVRFPEYDAITSRGEEITVKSAKQIKSADPITYDDAGNVIPLSERFNPQKEDIRYAQRDYDSDGNELSEGQREYFKDSKVRDGEGRLIPVYHGTKADFNVFDFTQGGVNGTQEGFGIYLTNDKRVSDSYGDRVIEGYANIKRPATSWQKTIKRGELVKLIKKTCMQEAQRMVNDGEYDSVQEALFDTWISNYVMTYESTSMELNYRKAADVILQANSNDMDIIQEVIIGQGIRSYPAAMEFYHNALIPTTGIDGFWTKWKSRGQGVDADVILAFDSNQVKNVDNINPTDNPDIRYSERDYGQVSDLDVVESLDEKKATTPEAKALIREAKTKAEKIRKLEARLAEVQSEKSGWKGRANRNADLMRMAMESKNRDIANLEKQIRHAQDILAGKIKNTSIQRMLAEARDTATAKARAQAQERYEKQKEKRALRERIVRHAGDLEQKLLKPSDKRHIPEQYRLATTALLNAINRESGFDYDPNTLHTTSRGATVGKRVEKGEGTATKRTQAFLALKEALQRIAAEDGFTGELLDFDGDGSGLISQALALGDVPISRMNMEQLGTIWQTVRALEHNITNFNRAFAAGRAETISGIADKFRTDTEGRKPRQRDAKNALDAKQMKLFAMTKYLENPYTFFDHYGESGHEMFRRLRDAQDLIQVRGDYIAEVWLGEMRNALGVTGTDEKVRKAVEDFVEKTDKAVEVFTLQSGQKLTLTHSMMMDVWLLSQREPTGLNHLLGSGVIQPKIDVKGHYTTRDATFRHLTIEDIQEIGSRLTEQEKATARAMQVVQRQLAKWGNEASMTVYGYRKFTEDNYWPVKNAREENKSESGQDNGRQATGTMNKGMARNLKPNAATGTEPVSAFRQLQGSISDMLTYSTWGPTLEDMNRVFNYKYKDESGATVTTVKSLVDQYGGEGSQRYWADLAKHISVGMGSSDNPIAAKIGRGVGAVKGARVAFNARVVVQQPTAYSRAAEVIDHKYLIASLGDLKSWSPGAKSAWNRALKYSPTARRKDSTTYDMGGSIRNDKALGLEKAGAVERFTELGTALAGKADALTWGRLWHAAELQISAKTSLEKGSAEYYDAVNKLFTEAVDRTQVMDGILQRPAIMRMNSDFVKGMTAYMGEPLMQVNMLMRQAASWKQVGWKVAKKAMFRTASGLLLSQIINAMIQSVFDATFRRTDEDKDWWERFLAEMSGIDGTEKSTFDKITGVLLGGNLVSETTYLNKIPGINDLLSLIEGYDPGNDRFDLAAAKDLINAVKLLSNDKYTGWHKAKELVSKMTMLFGVGVGNALRDIYGAAHNAVFDFAGPSAKFDFKAIWINPESKQNRRQYFDLLWQMLENGDKKGFTAYAEKLAGGGGDDLKKFVSGEAQDRYENGTIDAETFSEMMEAAGADEEYIEGRFYNSIRERHEKKLATDDEAYELLQKWAGKDSKDAWDIVRKWSAKEAFSGDPDDFKWGQYDDLYAAIAEDGDISGVVREYKGKGYTEKQVNDNTKGGIRAALTGGSITENEAIDLLTRYVTYTKDGQAVAFDKDKAWKTVQEWQAKAENDGDPDYSYNQYDDLFSAIDANKDVNGIVSELTAHGYDKDDVTKAVKGHLIDNYVAGKASETALKNQLSRYCGIVKTDEVSEIVNSANCKKATGYYPDSLKDGYVDGKLSKDNVISALKVYKGLDSTSASNRVRAWDFQKEHPDLKWDSDRVDAYYDKRPEGGGKSAYEAGISVETYDDYRNRAAKAKGVDANGDGRTDSGSKKAEILRIIDSLDLSRSQKDALYYINGWAASTIYEAPWH